jgi:hypothetical protein
MLWVYTRERSVPEYHLSTVLDVHSEVCWKMGIASAASPAGNSGGPAVDGLLPVGSCWFLRWISGLPDGSLEIPLKP